MAEEKNPHGIAAAWMRVGGIRDLLAAVNKGNEEALTGWGFDVVVGQAKSRKAGKVTNN